MRQKHNCSTAAVGAGGAAPANAGPSAAQHSACAQYSTVCVQHCSSSNRSHLMLLHGPLAACLTSLALYRAHQHLASCEQ